MHETRVAIAGLGAIGRALAKRLAAGMPGLALACAAARDRAKAQAWLDARRNRMPAGRARGIPRPCRSRGRMRAGRHPREHLHADAHGRQAGHGAQRRRPAAAPAPDRARQGAWRPDHRADRRAARPRRGFGRGGRHHQFGAHDHPQAAAAASKARPISSRTASRSTASTPRSWCFPAPPAKPRPASPPTSMWWRRCRSPASVPTAPPSRSGPIRR